EVPKFGRSVVHAVLHARAPCYPLPPLSRPLSFMPAPLQYSLNARDVERDELPVDVVLIGAGPANLACAIHLQRLLQERNLSDKPLLVLEKAAETGDHPLSGAVMTPRGMAELFPDWRERGCPVEADVTWDGFEVMLPKGRHRRLTGLLVPPQL